MDVHEIFVCFHPSAHGGHTVVRLLIFPEDDNRK